ncbi:MAG TPA: 7TM-DISM domain-containing protein [Oligoflexus sp.]|uniref:7TMR-DISMED2 domain-containing protein n=1 Tax=Oligoflexus sp. TaxID=1971216 RepID=UPI002D581B63|nr:7TM-DISM domain-containing protein [Oligoflexus sp.]HYX36512.1 7TM-DISM domain-containing protein [Oligoflexus sp.]
MPRLVRLIVLSIFILLALPLQAAPVVIDARTFEGVSVGRHLLLLEDRDGQLQQEDVAKLPDSAFFAVDEEVPNLKFSQSAYWARLTLDNKLPRTVPLIFEFGYPVVDTIDFYSMDDQGQWIRLEAGDRRPITGRSIAHRLAAFPSDVRTGSSSVLIRIQTQGSVQFPVKIWTPLAFHNHRVLCIR